MRLHVEEAIQLISELISAIKNAFRPSTGAATSHDRAKSNRLSILPNHRLPAAFRMSQHVGHLDHSRRSFLL